MKGKIAFVLGAAVGYVLGTRAGRERYEQIKRGAQTVWHTAPVQRGVSAMREATQTRVDELKATVVRAGKGAFASLLNDRSDPPTRPAGAGGGSAKTGGTAGAGTRAADESAPTAGGAA
ncbi:YtxH domain-containing protein [Leucobacter sp. wl10]|uniref:YtxH domain-containing protein n=1 Tax=Leucobacter sp. wl10 TaxID=2304677 RepID=UPI001F09D62C|nr:YtxH domain-containing protein [Leucobacter sp. wl10]